MGGVMQAILAASCAAFIVGLGVGLSTFGLIGPFQMAKDAWGFLGSVTGAGAAVVAVVIGAVLNAELSRKRDDRARQQERDDLVGLLKGDVNAERQGLEFAKHQFSQMRLEHVRAKGAKLSSAPSEPYEILRTKLHLIGGELAEKYVALRGYIWTIDTVLANPAEAACTHEKLMEMINKAMLMCEEISRMQASDLAG